MTWDVKAHSDAASSPLARPGNRSITARLLDDVYRRNAKLFALREKLKRAHLLSVDFDYAPATGGFAITWQVAGGMLSGRSLRPTQLVLIFSI